MDKQTVIPMDRTSQGYSEQVPTVPVEELNKVLQEIKARLPIEIEVLVPPESFVVSNNQVDIVVSSTKGNVMIYNSISREIEKEADKSNSSIISMAFSKDESNLLVVDKAGLVSCLQYPSLQTAHTLQLPQGNIYSIRHIRNSEFLVSTGFTQISILRADIQLELELLFDNNENISSYIIHNQNILIGSESGKLTIFDLQSNSYHSIDSESYAFPIVCIACNSTSSFMACALETNDIVLRDERFEVAGKLKGHSKGITGLEFVLDDKYLLSSSLDSNIILWVLEGNRKIMNLKIYDSPVTDMKYFKEAIYSSQKNNMVLIWGLPPIPKNSRLDRHNSEVTEIEFFRKSTNVITTDAYGTLIVWDFQSDTIVKEVKFNHKLSGFSINVDCTFCLVATEEPALFRMSLIDYTSELVMSDTLINCFKFTSDKLFVITGDNKNRLIQWELPDMKNSWVMKGHFKQITSVMILNTKNKALSGSNDCTIRLWDLKTHEFIRRYIGHEAPISSVRASKDGSTMYSASLDTSIRVWDIESGRLLYFIKTGNPVYNIKLISNQKYMIVAQEAGISYWDLLMHTKIVGMSFPEPTSTVNRSDNKGGIGVAAGNVLYVLNDPFLNTQFEVIGNHIDLKYQFMKYIYNLLTYSNVYTEYKPEFNELAFIPSFIGVMHVFLALGKYHPAKKSLSIEDRPAGIFNSFDGHNPLSLSIDNQHLKCTDLMIKYISKNSLLNRKLVSPLNGVLAKLNRMNLKCLPELYTSLFRKRKASHLSKSASSSTKLPLYNLNSNMLLHDDSFPIKAIRADQPLIYKSSIVQIDVRIGSKGSIDFLRSLISAPQKTILESDLIKYLLEYKWKKLRYFAFTETVLFIVYMILLVSFSYEENSTSVLAFLSLTHVLLCLIEFLNIIFERKEYFTSIWNIIDMTRIILYFLFLAFLENDENSDESNILLILVIFISGVRGISYFRIFKVTRSMINLITEVVSDIRSFLVLFFYVTIAFGLIITLVPSSDIEPSLSHAFIEGFKIDIGESETGEYELVDWLFFTLANIICPIVMLNLLIAIMSDTYERVQNTSIIADRLELIDMILQYERMIFWNNSQSKKVHLHVCLNEKIAKKDDDEWLGKIKDIGALQKKYDKQIKLWHEEIQGLNKGIDDLILKNKEGLAQIKSMVVEALDIKVDLPMTVKQSFLSSQKIS